jgi:hypothetical protein
MCGMRDDIRKFIFHDLRKIDGYIDPPDALVFLSLLQFQSSSGFTGGIAEIGVYYGRSYFLLRRAAGSDGKVLAIDLFDMDEQPDGTPAQYQLFLDNGRKLDIPVDENLVIRGDSTKLTPQDVTGKIGKVRFFSIDGGHMLHHVAADSELAGAALADCGIIAFDDTFNPAWPEVTVGVADFLRAQQGLFTAFCMTKYKTYVCRSPFHDLYRRAIEQSPELKPLGHQTTRFLGNDVARLDNPVGRRIAYELLSHAGLGRFSERIYR